MATKATSFSAPTHVMALTHPFVTPAYTPARGIPFLVDALSRESVGSDYWHLKNMNVINTKMGIALGNVGHGKSALLKIAAVRLMMSSAGYTMFRSVINDYKTEWNDSEYGKISKITGSVVFRMAQMRFNPFEKRLFLDKDGKMNILGLMNMAELLAEFSKKVFLSSVESVALSIALSIMLEMDEVTWTPAMLEKLSRSLTTQQIQAHYNRIDETLVEELSERARGIEDPSLLALTLQQIELYSGASNNFDVAEIKAAGVQVSFYYHNLLYGKSGAMFGTTHSMYDLYTQRAVTKDWRGLTFEAETLLRTIGNIIHMTAIENNRTDLLPHLNIDDEMHRPMSNIVYAKFLAYLSEIARSTSTLFLSASHRLASIRKGGEKSEQADYGATVINNMGFAFLGQQRNDAVVLNELADRFRLTTKNKNGLATLPPRHFVYVQGDTEPPRLVRTFATPSEIALLPTNQANDYMLDRPNPYNEGDIFRYAEENGFVYIPPGEGQVG